ncbi:hypothetical protein HPG69_004787, partial [Diceros bicornis minor]
VPGLPLPPNLRQTTGASAVLTISAFWPGLGPARLTSSPFPASEPRQGLRIQAASPLGSGGTLRPARSLQPPRSPSAPLGPEGPPSTRPKASLSSAVAASLFPSPGVQARPGLPLPGQPALSKGKISLRKKLPKPKS